MRDPVLKDKVDGSWGRTVGVFGFHTCVHMYINMHMHTHTILKREKNNLAFLFIKKNENNLLIEITDGF